MTSRVPSTHGLCFEDHNLLSWAVMQTYREDLPCQGYFETITCGMLRKARCRQYVPSDESKMEGAAWQKTKTIPFQESTRERVCGLPERKRCKAAVRPVIPAPTIRMSVCTSVLSSGNLVTVCVCPQAVSRKEPCTNAFKLAVDFCPDTLASVALIAKHC